MPDSTPSLSIGQVAERTGLSVHALRFYEREGLLVGPVRREGGRRVYTEQDLGWLEVCTRLRSSGMPLEAIRRYTDLVRQGAGNEAERLAILQEHEARVIAQISELTDCLKVISHKVQAYADSLCRTPVR
jgi:DNA-binding transcriptional MerR regulator